ncbi:MAG: 30S ribosomal protein S8 [Campylobacterales bacterium]
MLNDIIADGLTRIRNASLRRLDTTKLLYSKTMESTVQIFVDKGYVESFKVDEEGNKKFIVVALKYDDRGRGVINEIKRISKPGRRVYRGRDELKKFKNGYGTIVVSTSKGVLSNENAYKENVGGEALCSIW